MGKRTDFTILDKIETVLKPGTVLEGTLKFHAPLKICGHFRGIIESEAVLYIDSTAYIEADISTRVAVVSGTVHGNITASEKIEILPGSRISGDLKAARIKIADGVEFEGKCKMVRDPETIDIFSAGVERLKEIARTS